MSDQRPDPAAEEAHALRLTGAVPLRPGDPERIGPYSALALLGSGGMGRVYLARAADDGPGLFAVKVIRPEYAEDVGFRRRFEREALVHERVRSPRAPELRGTGFAAELLWMATEYLPALDLAAAVREFGSLSPAAGWRLVAELGEALEALAAARIVHRDLKPSNILVSDAGSHVIDFGIAKAADASALTGTGNRLGTPAYMSPEYLRTGECVTASDVFSLACALVYATTGHAPFGDGTGVDVMHRVAFEDPDPQVLAQVHADDPVLAALLASCLAKDPAHRPTPRALREAAAERGTPPQWPDPLYSRLLGLRQAYDVLHALPAARATLLRGPATRPPLTPAPPIPTTPPPRPLSRPAPAELLRPTPPTPAPAAPSPHPSSAAPAHRKPPTPHRGKARSRTLVLIAVAALCALAATLFLLTRPGPPAAAAPPEPPGTVTTAPAQDTGAEGRGHAETPAGAKSPAPALPDAPTTAPATDRPPTSDAPQPQVPSPTSESTPPDTPAPADCSYYSGNGRTGPGDSGKKVLQVQCLLLQRGYDIGGPLDGSYGDGTAGAVRALQADAGLPGTGAVDRATWGALRAAG